jgi:hypothetical protein
MPYIRSRSFRIPHHLGLKYCHAMTSLAIYICESPRPVHAYREIFVRRKFKIYKDLLGFENSKGRVKWRCQRPRRSFRPIRSSFSGFSLFIKPFRFTFWFVDYILIHIWTLMSGFVTTARRTVRSAWTWSSSWINWERISRLLSWTLKVRDFFFPFVFESTVLFGFDWNWNSNFICWGRV